jgi:hypothetical protein
MLSKRLPLFSNWLQNVPRGIEWLAGLWDDVGGELLGRDLTALC